MMMPEDAYYPQLRRSVASFYAECLPWFTKKGSRKATYQAGFEADIQAMNAFRERIKLGVPIAEAKLAATPSIADIVNNEETLRKILRDPEREDAVITRTREVAGRYDFDPDVAARIFRWAIDTTLDAEVYYLLYKFPPRLRSRR